MAKERVPVLFYLGIPVIGAVLLILQINTADPYILLRNELLVVFGYIAAINDIRTKKISNKLVLVMLAAWVCVSIPKLFLDTQTAITLLLDSVLGFTVGGGLFLLVYYISRKGIGGGDVKFMAAAGLFLGLYYILPAMLYGTVIAALTGIVLILLKIIGRKDTIPLAPFLYAGILITVFLRL